MDIIKLSDRLIDIKLGDVADGRLVIRINKCLPDDKIIYSTTTGAELRQLYMSLTIPEQKQLDKAICLVSDPELLTDILSDINYIEVQRRVAGVKIRETQYIRSIVLMILVIIFNTMMINNYHNTAMSKLGITYRTNTLTVFSTTFKVIDNLVNSFENTQ